MQVDLDVKVPPILGAHVEDTLSQSYGRGVGVGGTDGGGVGATAHLELHCASVWLPVASAKQRPVLTSQLNIALHVAAQCACCCVPVASSLHVPVLSSQRYAGAGVGAGVGGVGGAVPWQSSSVIG